ncbi:hypothetical protein N7468_005454 [Penicillium chermesinum]|uniref:Uncharacterized protein n=1 Tax=Penicillium chermesinum TaxID=63820 RepID=A0A9W9P1W3_9EURO|nr:uncharacterized protein N7468_005454 [Penicillium chermesinum]KAJ5232498.1 hypothetical protein N7468_005454 [Penicillium chermesinum]
MQTLTRQAALANGPPVGSTPIDWNLTPSKWLDRVAENNFSWFCGSRIILDCHYRALSICFVSLMPEDPTDWPPAFGKMAESYTIRKFWG